MQNAVFQALAEAAQVGEPVSLGIITSVKGSSPQKIGAKALFYPDGRIQGTMGGGCLEAEIQHRAIEALRTGLPEKFDLLLDHDFGWDDGLICGGKVLGLILPNAQNKGWAFWSELARRHRALTWGITDDFAVLETPRREDTEKVQVPHWIYQEKVMPPCELWIAGAGHISQAVAPLALQLDFKVTVFDDRPALVNHHYFPPSVSLVTDVWERLLQQQVKDEKTFGLIVTRGHRHDALVLRNWITQPFQFLGMIGSARKARIIFEHFREENIASPEQLARVACPVGIRMRCESVAEIAVSIMAQFIDKRAELLSRSRETIAA
jgi:xanthine dehydrogenase accessory factor